MSRTQKTAPLSNSSTTQTTTSPTNRIHSGLYPLPSSFGLSSLHGSHTSTSQYASSYPTTGVTTQLRAIQNKRKTSGLLMFVFAGVVGGAIYWLAQGEKSELHEPAITASAHTESVSDQDLNQDLAAENTTSELTSSVSETRTSPAKDTAAPAKAVPSAARTALFAYDKATLSKTTRATLDAWVQRLNRDKNSSLVIEGHCDERGSAAYNYKLGKSRADAAKAYMVKKGIDKNRLTTVSYGKTRLLVSEKNSKSRAKNRRIEIQTAQLLSKN